MHFDVNKQSENMKHKVVKDKILESMMFRNPDNVWVSLDEIVMNIHRIYHIDVPEDIVVKICDELKDDGIINVGTVLHYQQCQYCDPFEIYISIYKINSPCIENFRSVET